MIKFFRHIRKRLLSENRFSKYLLYAIGEIILVVIGILIALQLNSWKDARNDRDLEYKILKGLLLEFENAELELQRDTIWRYEIFKSVQYVLNIKNGSVQMPEAYDTIAATLDIAKSYRFYTPSHPQLKNLQSSGSFDLLSSKETSKALLNYVEWWDRVTVLEQNGQKAIITNLRPYLSDHCDLSLLSAKNQSQEQDLINQFKAMADDPKLGSIMRLRLEDLYTIRYYSQDLMRNIIICKSAIKNDLAAYD